MVVDVGHRGDPTFFHGGLDAAVARSEKPENGLALCDVPVKLPAGWPVAVIGPETSAYKNPVTGVIPPA